ncbi:MAG: Xaa-Pro peptidase family protein [Oscillospiraceae bacterium]|nr:Xaa-Pro peptidase family protein [Oscillospiraceae bacterium]
MNNISKIQKALHGQEFGAYLVTGAAGRLYTGGFASSAGAYLITPDEAFFFVDPRYVEAARENISGAEVLLVTGDETFPEKIGKFVKDKDLTSVGFEDGVVTYSVYKEWDEKFGVKLIGAQKFLSDLRNVKSREDLEGMIKAQRISEKALEEVLPLINSNITEKELATELIYRIMKNGAEKSFDPIVVSGPRSSLPHGVPTDEKIAKGFLTIDWGAKVDGWCSDTTRTFCIGQPDDEIVKIYETVLAAQEAGIATVKAGVSAKDVDTAARDVITKAGYGEYFGHGLGHGLGLEVHEALRCSQTSTDILPAGATLTSEPGIYLPGRYGCRIEDTLYVTETGYENITKIPKKMLII